MSTQFDWCAQAWGPPRESEYSVLDGDEWDFDDEDDHDELLEPVPEHPDETYAREVCMPPRGRPL